MPRKKIETIKRIKSEEIDPLNLDFPSPEDQKETLKADATRGKNKRTFGAKYVCECGKEFKRNQSLNNHRNFVCGKMKQRYCSMCKKFFWAHQQLMEHQKQCHDM